MQYDTGECGLNLHSPIRTPLPVHFSEGNRHGESLPKKMTGFPNSRINCFFMEQLTFTINRIIFASKDSCYTIAAVETENGRKETVVGEMPSAREGMQATASGEWVNNPKYGLQFAIRNASFTEVRPTSLLGIKTYLASGLIQGIGPVLAERIVDHFGFATLSVMDNQPTRLKEIPGIGKKKMQSIIEGWEEQKCVRDIMIFLKECGVSDSLAGKIYRKYGSDSIAKLKENPYRLSDDIRGVGFRTADAIALRMGLKPDDPFRLRSGIKWYIEEETEGKGHVYVDYGFLVQNVADTLPCRAEGLAKFVDEMVENKELIREHDNVYLPSFSKAEDGTARRLKELLSQPAKGLFTEGVPNDGTDYDPVQRRAIETALSSRVFVLTGGPGVGKTTTIRGIIGACEAAGEKVLLAAPTGRAAKRMKESTGREARTIHRLLEYGMNGFGRDEGSPLEGDTLIVDESSMIDQRLMWSLLKAVPNHMRLILVGDVDQLPSVGPGNVLRDIIFSHAVPTVRLTKIFRQAAGSHIILNSHRINRGMMPEVDNRPSSDCFFQENDDPAAVADAIVSLVTERLPRKLNVSPEDIQVLTPQHRGILGTEELNRRIQARFAHNDEGMNRGDTVFHKGDRVMQTKNDYKKNVFNGDVGYVESTEDGVLVVDFGESLVRYERREIDDLELAYACTIHKSQGSEYPVVVMPVMKTHAHMLQRNLVYTGLTRAKKTAVILGETQAMRLAVFNDTVKKRNTRLREKLAGEDAQEALGEPYEMVTLEELPEYIED